MNKKVTLEEAHNALVEQTRAMDTANTCAIGIDRIYLYFTSNKEDKECSFQGTEFMGWSVERVITGANFTICPC